MDHNVYNDLADVNDRVAGILSEADGGESD